MEWTFKGSDDLRRALQDIPVRRALERLHRLKRLEELNAPKPFISDASGILDKSILELPPNTWDHVQKIYPEYRAWEEQATKVADAWENRCRNCIYMIDQDFNDSDDLESWCKKYTVSARTMPKPCPDFADERN